MGLGSERGTLCDKLDSIFGSRNYLTPLLVGLIWPFLVKLSFSSRLVRETYTDLVSASGLFFFRLRQMAVEAERLSGSRWGRTLLLAHRSMVRARRSMRAADLEDEESLHALSMIAL
ncbi:hypothetical protein SAY86_000113 [Trapa natans]|uniref:Uncharacterized protein n=1 Tax=Trapa natans TaxID=22666 RepID=A0AAN7MTW1_TRANT|nr:hypothetical protein SAY86_000113 [Trapa natans]